MDIDLILRFIVGGLVVSAFAVIGDMVRPKAFAGIFGAAPSVALATLGLTLASKGGTYASIEGRSMIVGAIALCVYSTLSGLTLLKRSANAFVVAGTASIAWFLVAFGLYGVLLR